MKKILQLVGLALLSLGIIVTPVGAGDTWDNIKKKSRMTKAKTKLKLNRSKYEDKIKAAYTRLGEQVYKKDELQEKVSTDPQCSGLIKKVDVYNQKIVAIEAKLKELEQGEEVSDEDIDDIDEGFGLESTSESSTPPIEDSEPPLSDESEEPRTETEEPAAGSSESESDELDFGN